MRYKHIEIQSKPHAVFRTRKDIQEHQQRRRHIWWRTFNL